MLSDEFVQHEEFIFVHGLHNFEKGYPDLFTMLSNTRYTVNYQSYYNRKRLP